MLGTEIPRYPLINEKVAPAISVAFTVATPPGYSAVTVTAHGLSVGESIPVEIKSASGVWGEASSYDPNTSSDRPVAMTFGANTITINGLGVYRVNKGVTSKPASVTLYR